MHTIKWRLYPDEMVGEIECREPHGLCRLSHFGGDEDCRVPQGSAVGSDCSCGQLLSLQKSCNYCDWLGSESGLIADYGGPRDEPVRDGPVEFAWEGDHFSWHYAEVVEDLTMPLFGEAAHD